MTASAKGALDVEADSGRLQLLPKRRRPFGAGLNRKTECFQLLFLALLRTRSTEPLMLGANDLQALVIVEHDHLAVDKHLENFFGVLPGAQRRIGQRRDRAVVKGAGRDKVVR